MLICIIFPPPLCPLLLMLLTGVFWITAHRLAVLIVFTVVAVLGFLDFFLP